MFGLFVENYLISQYQSGFKPEDYCINLILSITREIYQSFDEGFDVRSAFLDISICYWATVDLCHRMLIFCVEWSCWEYWEYFC